MAVVAGTALALGGKMLANLLTKGIGKKKEKKQGGGLMGKVGEAVGDGMGSKAALGLGIGEKLIGAMQTKRADAMLPAMVDPKTQGYLETTQRRRRALETGTASSAERAAEQQMMTSMGKRMAKSGGMNLNLLNQMMAQNATRRSAETGQEIAGLLGMEGQTVSEMAQRKADISSLRSARMAARGAQNESAGTDNIAAGLGISPSKKKKKKGYGVDNATTTA